MRRTTITALSRVEHPKGSANPTLQCARRWCEPRSHMRVQKGALQPALLGSPIWLGDGLA